MTIAHHQQPILVLMREGYTAVHVSRTFFFFQHHFSFPAQLTRRRFYPQRSAGQAVVTGVIPSPPRYVPSFLSRIGFSIPAARRVSSNVANSRSRAFR